MRSRVGAIFAVAVAALVAVGCGAEDGGGGGGDNKFDGNMTIGALIPLTGGLADFGRAGETAANLAIEQLNEAAGEAGLEGEATLAVEDTETEEDAAKSAAEKLVRSENASCIAGAWASSSTKGVAQSVTIDAGVPIISPSSTDPTITDLEDENLVWRTAPSDLKQSEILAQQIAEDLGGEGTVSPAAINNDYGASFMDAFSTAAENEGLTVNEPVLYDPAGAQFSAEAQQIVQGNPDAFVVVDYPDQAWPKMGPALVRTGQWSADKTWTADGLRSTDLPEQLGARITEGMRGTAPVAVESEASAAFDQLWTESDAGERQTYDAQNFDAVVLCYLAAVAAGSSDGEDIAAELQNVSGGGGTEVTLENLAEGIELLREGEDIDYQGVSGPIDFDENGDPTAAVYEIWQYKNGKLITIDTVPVGSAAEAAGEGDGGDDTSEGATEEEATTGDEATAEEETTEEGGTS